VSQKEPTALPSLEVQLWMRNLTDAEFDTMTAAVNIVVDERGAVDKAPAIWLDEDSGLAALIAVLSGQEDRFAMISYYTTHNGRIRFLTVVRGPLKEETDRAREAMNRAKADGDSLDNV
jgi:hypothetical protein